MKNMKDVIEFLKEAEESGVNHRLAQLYIDKAKADFEKAKEVLDRSKEEAVTLKQEYEDKLDSCPVEGMQKTKIKKMVEERLDQMFELGLISLPEGLPDEDAKPARRKRRTRKTTSKVETEETTTQNVANPPTDETASPDASSSNQSASEIPPPEHDNITQTVKDALKNRGMLDDEKNLSDQNEGNPSDKDVTPQVESKNSIEQVSTADHSSHGPVDGENEGVNEPTSDSSTNFGSQEEASNEDAEDQIPEEILQNEDFDNDESNENDALESDASDSIKMPSFLQ